MLYPDVLPACEASRLENRSGRLVLDTLQDGQGLTAMTMKGTRKGCMQRRRESRHEARSGVEEEKMNWLALLGETWSRGVQEGAKDVANGWAKWDEEQ